MHCYRSEGDFCDEDGNAMKLAPLFPQQIKKETAKGTVSASPGPFNSQQSCYNHLLQLKIIPPTLKYIHQRPNSRGGGPSMTDNTPGEGKSLHQPRNPV
jgi:hypothetical protein